MSNNRVLSKLRYNYEWNIMQLLKWLENLFINMHLYASDIQCRLAE